MVLDYDEFPSPVGRILFVSTGEGICALDYEGYEKRMESLLARRFGEFEFRRGSDPLRLKPQLREYFDGNLHALDGTPVSARGSTFQERVWGLLRAIPPGETRTYGQLATSLNASRAVRAVGHANSLNPVAIVVPCHRVIGASSSLTGYAGGLERKQWLLRHEGALLI
jgi:methylated-DNA-[protein]-cysteine S-methyltransferase